MPYIKLDRQRCKGCMLCLAVCPQKQLRADKDLNQKGAHPAFFLNEDCKGFSFIEILSACPTYWNLSPLESMDWMRNALIKEFPLGRLK